MTSSKIDAFHPPVDSRVGADGCYGRPHVLQVPHLHGAVVASRDDVVPHGEDGGRHGAAEAGQSGTVETGRRENTSLMKQNSEETSL